MTPFKAQKPEEPFQKNLVPQVGALQVEAERSSSICGRGGGVTVGWKHMLHRGTAVAQDPEVETHNGGLSPPDSPQKKLNKE